jgi:hypothetical protein
MLNLIYKVSYSHSIDPLNNDGGSSTASVTNSCNTILTHFQLMQQCSQNPGSGTTKRVAKRDSASKWVDICAFETEELRVG